MTAQKTDSECDDDGAFSKSSDHSSERRDKLFPIRPLSRSTKTDSSGRPSTRGTKCGRWVQGEAVRCSKSVHSWTNLDTTVMKHTSCSVMLNGEETDDDDDDYYYDDDDDDDDDDDFDSDNECASAVARVSVFRMILHRCFPTAFPIPSLYQARIEPAGTIAANRDGVHHVKTLVPAPDDPLRPSTDYPRGMFVHAVPGFEVTEIRFPKSGQTYRETK